MFLAVPEPSPAAETELSTAELIALNSRLVSTGAVDAGQPAEEVVH
jgi:hypothetical protein